MQKLEDEIMQLVRKYGMTCYDQSASYMQDDWHAGEDAEVVVHQLLGQIREKIHDLVLQVDHSNLVVEAAKEKIEEQDDYKAWYEEAMVASNEAGCVGMSAAETIRYLAYQTEAQPADALDATDREHLAIGRALNRAALELPADGEIRIEIENGAGAVYVNEPKHGDWKYIDSGDVFSAQINEAIDAAMVAAQEEKPQTSLNN